MSTLKFKYKNLSIYNRDELLIELQLEKSSSNEELVLKGYEVWRETFFNKINGDFAFAIYDEDKDLIIAARDALGIKALYYVVNNGQYYFSNDIDELFRLSGLEKKPNINSMRTLLEQKAVDYEDTMYENIKRVPLGHYLKFEKDKHSLNRYWFPEKIDIDYNISLNEAAKKFKALFAKSILARVDDAKETVYELSGGLDSSSIVSLLKNQYPEQKTDTFSMSFEGLNCDESPYIEAIEEKYNFQTKRINVEKLDYTHKYNFDFNYSMSPHWPITTTFTMSLPMMEAMKKNGKKVIITGQGGDHLLTGNCYILADLFQRAKFKKIWKELMYVHYGHIHSLTSCVVLPLLDKNQKKIIKRLLSPFIKSFKKENNLQDIFELKEMTSASKKVDIHILISAAQSTLMDGNLFHAAESTYDLEFRHPFFDKKLVEFILTLPTEYKYSRSWIKVLLRYAMEDVLPEKIRLRNTKAEFSEILIQQLNAFDLRKLFENSSLVSLDLVKENEINNLLNEFEHKKYNNLSLIWRIVNLEYWYQHTSAKC